MLKLENQIDTIICDIEGTTTSISFVKDVLFPYVRENLKSYIEINFQEQELIEDIDLLRSQALEDSKKDKNVPLILDNSENKQELIASLIRNVIWQMDLDRKTKGLKQLQGHIWSFAYKNRLVTGHVYDDVIPAFDRWLSRGIKLYIYSSGSIQAQKLLFGHTAKGDLNSYFSGNFDTTIGLKIESSSYQNILKDIGKSPSQVLFLTDLIREAEAARNIGIKVVVVRRNDNPDKETKDFESITSFDEIE